jgi:hypothetical protein
LLEQRQNRTFVQEDSMPPKKSTRAKISSRPKKIVRAEAAPRISTSPDSKRMMGVGALLVVFCVMAAAMLLTAREPSSSPAVGGAGLQPESPLASADSRRSESAVRPSLVAASMKLPAADAAKSPGRTFSSVTITGCLERRDDGFRLTDTDGSDAPKARSWKSGFLKKDSASLEVVDAGNRVKLPSHVGRRVSVTGLLDDRELQVRSLRRIAPACD